MRKQKQLIFPWVDMVNTMLSFRVCLDTAENWKLKLKTEKHCSKIIFKCVNSTVGPIYNEKVAKKWNLWIHKQWNLCWKGEKSQILRLLFMNSSRNSKWTEKKIGLICVKKKKERKTETQTRISAISAQSKRALGLLHMQ